MPNETPLTEQPVARADAPKGDGQEGVNPIVVNPDQPVFPRPVGVAADDLKKQGVVHGYASVPEDGGDGGPAAAVAPEGKPRDPEEEAKTEASAQVAKDNATTVQATPTGQPVAEPGKPDKQKQR